MDVLFSTSTVSSQARTKNKMGQVKLGDHCRAAFPTID